jgi:hypothetical protein
LDDEVLNNFGAEVLDNVGADPETWDPYDGHVDVPNIVNMDDPVWVNVYDRLVSEELMPEELVSQMRADGNSEMYIDAVLVEMEELMETRAGEIRNFLRSVVEPTPATPGLINTADNIDYGPTLEQMIPADPVYLPFPDVDDPTRPALTTLDVEEIAAEAEAAGPPPALLGVDDTLAEAGFDGVPYALRPVNANRFGPLVDGSEWSKSNPNLKSL